MAASCGRSPKLTRYRPPTVSITLRDLTTVDDLRRVPVLEQRVWQYPTADELIPVAILAPSVRRGAIVVGAFDGDEMVGVVYSMPAIHRGSLSHWSHVLGVLPEYRTGGLGLRLKLAQRERALAMGIDLIEWTYDPLLAANAHLNCSRLGAVVEEYELDVYGSSDSPLHGSVPTDRFIAQWKIRTPHVARRLAPASPLQLVSQGAAAAPFVNDAHADGGWERCGSANLSLAADRVRVRIPPSFAAMLRDAPDLAAEWRQHSRGIFKSYFERGYRAVDFFLNRTTGGGDYLLSRIRQEC
jgi:predicted GNAT superfamily acetyltransferase